MEHAHAGNTLTIRMMGVAEEVLSSVANSVMVSADKAQSIVAHMGTVGA